MVIVRYSVLRKKAVAVIISNSGIIAHPGERHINSNLFKVMKRTVRLHDTCLYIG